MSPVHGVRTIALYVDDAEAAARFYVGHPGLEITAQHAGRYELAVGGSRLLLHPTDTDDVDRAEARHGRTEVYLEVTDVDSLVRDLAAAGTEVLQEPTDQPWGERDAAVVDPDGFPIFLTQVQA